MMDYVPIYTKIWSDTKFKKLSKHAKLLFLYMNCNSAVNIIGIYEFDKEAAQMYLLLSDTEFEEAFKSVVSTMGVEHDIVSGYIFIKNKFKYQSSSSFALKKYALRELDKLHSNKFRKKFLEVYAHMFADIKQTMIEGSDVSMTEIQYLFKLFGKNEEKLSKHLIMRGLDATKISDIFKALK